MSVTSVLRGSIQFRLAFLVGILVLSSSLWGQQYRATVTGRITDPSGSPVPNAEIIVTGAETGVVNRGKTDDTGNYAVPFLVPGTYSVKATASGFTGAVRDNVELHAGDKTQVDLPLQLGQNNQTVTVQASGELLQSATASVGQVIDAQQTRDLPVLGRNPFMLAALASGVSSGLYNGKVSQLGRPFDGAAAQLSIGGIGSRYLILLNGVPNNPPERGSAAIYLGFSPSPEAVEEVNVQTNIYDAQYGHTSGAVLNTVLRSGTNALHGSLYEYFRNTVLNANTFESNAAGTPTSVVHWNQPGLMFSGPVMIPKLYDGRNKTFFMVSWERVWNVNPYSYVGSVPTLAERQGDFSGLTQANSAPITIYDPLTTSTTAPYGRQAFAGNRIPSNRIDPVAQRLINYYPLPNQPGIAGGFNNYVNTPNSQVDQYNSTSIRIDHQLNDNQKLNGVWFRNVRNQQNPAAGYSSPATPYTSLGSGYDVIRNNYGGSIDYSNVLSPTTVLDLRYGMIYHPFALAYYGDNFDLSTLGLPSSFISQLSHQTFPGVALSNNYSSIVSNSVSNTASQYSTSNVHDVTGVISHSRGGHTIKTGAEWYLLRANNSVPVSNTGTFSFTSGFTQQNALVTSAASGNPIASLLLGYPAGGSVNNNIASAYQQLYYGGFLHDDWRVNSRLTLNLGIRWDYESPMSERYYRQNRGFAFGQTNPLQAQVTGLNLTGGLLFTDGVNKLPFRNDYNNWQPRIGAAFRLTEKTVLRGGFGVNFMPTFDTGQSNGFSSSTSLVGSVNNANLVPAVTLTNPYPVLANPSGRDAGLLTLLGQGFTFSNPNRTVPKVYNYSFGVQRQLPGQIVVEAFYSGNLAQSISVSKGINSLPAQYFALGNSVLTGSVTNPLAGKIPTNAGLNGATTSYQNLLLPYPEFGSITESNNAFGKSYYNSLQVNGQKRLTAGLQMRASFTWSKIMTQTSYLNNQDDFSNLAKIQSNEPNKIFVLSGSYALPIFTKTQGFLHSTLGGWNLNMIFRVQAGYLINMPTGVFSTGVNPKLSNPAYNHWFNTCTLNTNGTRSNCIDANEPVAWTVQPAFTLNQANGNSTLPGVRTDIPPNLDLSLFKSFSIRERAKVEFRAEAFNLANTAAFGGPNTSFSSSSFGVVTRVQTNDPRLLQLALKLNF